MSAVPQLVHDERCLRKNKKKDWSLSFINYPLLLLAKSCKLVPVMLVGVVMLGRRHTRAEYLAVGLITAGVALFSFKPAALEDAELTKEDGGHAGSSGSNLIGLALVRRAEGESGCGGARYGVWLRWPRDVVGPLLCHDWCYLKRGSDPQTCTHLDEFLSSIVRLF